MKPKLPIKFEVRAASGGTPPEILIYDALDPWFGVSARGVAEALSGMRSEREINVRINSPGGDAFEGVAIYNALVHHRANINVFVDSQAASAASIIAMAGNTISIAENSIFHLHRGWAGVVGNRADHEEAARKLADIDDIMAKIYSDANRNGMTTNEALNLMAGEPDVDGTWLTAAEAMDLGFADEMTENLKIAACIDPERFHGEIPERFQQYVPDKRVRSLERITSWLDSFKETV